MVHSPYFRSSLVYDRARDRNPYRGGVGAAGPPVFMRRRALLSDGGGDPRARQREQTGPPAGGWLARSVGTAGRAPAVDVEPERGIERPAAAGTREPHAAIPQVRSSRRLAGRKARALPSLPYLTAYQAPPT